MSRPEAGTVYLVGAGPGDPGLITVRGQHCLRHADVVLYDRLVHPDLLAEAPVSARRIFVGKSPGRPGLGQELIHRLLILHARRGQVVVRLKGGDPFVFGRGSEEAVALDAAGIPWEVVPAVSSAFGVPARAGIPLTHRGLARGFAVITGHRLDDDDLDWSALATLDTVVVLMGVATLAATVRQLMRHGRAPATPVAVISRGTLPDEQVVVGRLTTIVEQTRQAAIEPPATVVIGEVARFHEELHVATAPPLDGRVRRAS